MKILAIRGKNLASLADEFEVDFEGEPLKSAGLFAITGPTGAGKSTLLDALCMALYENTPRLLTAGNKTVPDVGKETVTQQDARNLLRRGAAEGYAEVDFVGNDGVSYRSRWSVRRARTKSDGSLQKTHMSLKTLSDLQSIGGTNREVLGEIVKRIGLSFDQFTRAVLLAQNEFSAFLKADDSDRGGLLETLTGSTIYSTLSQLAFVRARHEQHELQRINDRLADQKPLANEALLQLEQGYNAANVAVAAFDQRKLLLEVQLRWYNDDEKFRLNEQAAFDQLLRAQAENAATASRRFDLRRVESVQDARPIVTEIDRLTRAIAQDNATINECQSKLTNTDQACKLADTALENAQITLLHAEQAQSEATPILDRAKALDTRIEMLLPAHRQAQQEKEDAATATAIAQRSRLTKQSELDGARENQQSTMQWLEQNVSIRALSESWQRWDVLLKQSCTSRNELLQYERALSENAEKEKTQNNLLVTETAALDSAHGTLETVGEKRDEAKRHHASIDISRLPERRKHANARLEQLIKTEQLWRTLSDKKIRQQQLDERSRRIEQTRVQTDVSLRQVSEKIPHLNAALKQAERSLKNAEAACAESVETLRAALDDDSPCPVCGATNHPYSGENPQLHAMLETLRLEVQDCRQQTQLAHQQQATHLADAASYRQQLDVISQEAQQLQTLIQRYQREWQEHPIAIELPDIASEQIDWFAIQQTTAQTELSSINDMNAAYLAAVETKDAVQIQFEQATNECNIKREAVNAAQAELLKIRNVREATVERLTQCRQQLNDILAQIDLAFPSSGNAKSELSTFDTDWRGNWHANPETFHVQCGAHAQLWQARCADRDNCQQRITTLSVELNGLVEIQRKVEADQLRADSTFETSASHIKELQAQRNELFGGQSAQQVETALTDAIAIAKTGLRQQTQNSNDSKQAHAKATEAFSQAKIIFANHMDEAQSSSMRLADWINRYNVSNDNAAMDIAQLRTLLSHTGEWIANERNQLQMIDAAVQQAATVLAERNSQRQSHQERLPQPEDVIPEDVRDVEAMPEQAVVELDATPVETLQREIEGINAELQKAQVKSTELQIALAQDNARRLNVTEILASFDQQEAKSRVWAQLNELIGASDGKKFRNYAQQTTLDVLLGYANNHLNILSRRYRLQRINDSLALMVVDQDMGDELRSVHSLSGGESFLVSLALALGLASLSSNRVRVESLFIDEGFGSLDAETLGVAMDALDGLQSMGRKVGVISHVQEMTERITTRISVRRVSGGRSVVITA